MTHQIRAGQHFDKPNGERVRVMIVSGTGRDVTAVECQIITQTIPCRLLDTVTYTEAEYLAAKGAR